MNDELNKFMDNFYKLLKKYAIDDVILINFDDDSMGYQQLVKITNTDQGKYLVFSFSGRGDTLCADCKKEKR